MTEFRFYTESGLVRFSGRKANDLKGLLRGVRGVSGSSIFYHMYHSMFRRHITPAEYMNDFARWSWLDLGEQGLAEQLAVVDPLDCLSVREVRDKTIDAVECFLGKGLPARKVQPGKEFCFLEIQSFVCPLGLVARNLQEFSDGLREVGPGSIFHHFVEARIRLGRKCSDFSCWMGDVLGETELAEKVDSLSPYVYNLWELKQKILDLIAHRMKGVEP